jgi:hypothetical protein
MKLLKVFKNYKFGLISNDNGELITDYKYDYIESFVNKFCIVGLSDKEGFIDENGDEICEIKYDWVDEFNTNGTAIILNKQKYGLLYKDGTEIIPTIYDNDTDLTPDVINNAINQHERNLKLNLIV